MPQDPWDDHNRHLKDFPDHVLFDVARNESAQRSYRRHAVEILVNRKSPRVQHPDLADLVAELEIELDGIQFEYPAPTGNGALTASVTTATMQANDVVPQQADPTAEKEPECPTELPLPTSPDTEKLSSTPTGNSVGTKTPRSTKKASSKPIASPPSSKT